MSEGLWPRPTVEQKFAELQQQDEAFLSKLREVEKGLQALRSLHCDLTNTAAEVVRMAIMQRKNAEDALTAIKSPNAEVRRGRKAVALTAGLEPATRKAGREAASDNGGSKA
ncbi:MAG: hypothetical protein ACKVQA_23535 [Burkholderiales bacterium]